MASVLVTAVKIAWTLCPEANKHHVRPELEKLCSKVASKFGSSRNMKAIQPHIAANTTRRGSAAGVHRVLAPDGLLVLGTAKVGDS